MQSGLVLGSLDPWGRFHSDVAQSVLKESPKAVLVVGSVEAHDVVGKLDARALGQPKSEIGSLNHAGGCLEKASSRCIGIFVALILPVNS